MSTDSATENKKGRALELATRTVRAVEVLVLIAITFVGVILLVFSQYVSPLHRSLRSVDTRCSNNNCHTDLEDKGFDLSGIGTGILTAGIVGLILIYPEKKKEALRDIMAEEAGGDRVDQNKPLEPQQAQSLPQEQLSDIKKSISELKSMTAQGVEEAKPFSYYICTPATSALDYDQRWQRYD